MNEGRNKGGLGVPAVTSVEPVQRADLWTYQGGRQKTYLKITVAMPNLVPAAKGEGVREGPKGGGSRQGPWCCVSQRAWPCAPPFPTHAAGAWHGLHTHAHAAA